MSIASLIPPSLRGRVLPRRLPHARTGKAGLLLADISGFTTLSEKLERRGREGAEEIAAVVNAAFAPAIEAIERHGGSIESFGGDALFATFADPGGAARGVAAAERIAASFAEHGDVSTSAGSVRLHVSQAVHHGKVSYLHLGEQGRRHYLVAGRPVRELAVLEAKASGGRLLVSPAARKQCRASPTTTRIRAAAPSVNEALRPYLPARLLPMLRRFQGEYRRVAILFLETRGDALASLNVWFLHLARVLDTYEGQLLKSDLSPQGTKWICLFGVPEVHEEDPDRAARAALDLLAKVPRGLSARGGLNAGIVASIMIGTRGRKSFDVMGDVVNTAARAMGNARWGEILVTEETRKLLSGVKTKDRGTHAVKGKAEPLTLHALASARAVSRQIRVLAPMIGRDDELRQIVEALEKAKAGHGSAIGIKGDPGLGKSRLKYEAGNVARAMGFDVHEGRAISFGGMAYWTIGALLKDALGLPEVPGNDDVLAKVSAAAERLGMKAVDSHHLADVLGARYPGSPIEHLQPKDIRLNAMIAIRAYCQALAKEKPRLLVLEDMHWADGASAEAAEWLTKAAGEASCVVLLLYRPGYEPGKGTTEIVLGDLGEDAVEELLLAHLGMVPAAVGKLVKERAGGNPFYVEEVVRHLLEAGILGMSDKGYAITRPVRAEDLPESIEALIAARLDRLSSDARRVAQLGAVIGRSFLFELLTRLEEAARAREGVEELQARELIFEKQRDPHLEYIFKHALTRDVAYGSILVARRRKLHLAVAEGIEALFAEERQAFLAMLGHHWERAGEREEARECYLAGARKAAEGFAHEEAERLYRAYLGLVEEPTPESVAARNALGQTVLFLLGRAREAEAEHRRALEEARGLGSRRGEGQSLRALGVIHWRTGRMEEARALYEHALAIAREVGNRRSEGLDLGNLALLHDDQGRREEARALYEQALGIAREVGDRKQEGMVLGNLAILHHRQGRMEEARGHYEQALAIDREVGDRRSEGLDLGNLAVLRQEQGRVEEARALYQQALAIACEVGDRRNEGIALGNLATVHDEQGRMVEAHALYEQALAIDREVGNRVFEGFVLGKLAALDRVAGDPERAAELASGAENILAALGDKIELGKVLCERGHIELASGRSASGLLERARVAAGEARAGAESKLSESIGELARAQDAFASSSVLVCGMCPGDVPAGIMAWLREHRPDAIEGKATLTPGS